MVVDYKSLFTHKSIGEALASLLVTTGREDFENFVTSGEAQHYISADNIWKKVVVLILEKEPCKKTMQKYCNKCYREFRSNKASIEVHYTAKQAELKSDLIEKQKGPVDMSGKNKNKKPVRNEKQNNKAVENLVEKNLSSQDIRSLKLFDKKLKYPLNFPNLSNEVGGIVLTKACFRTLIANAKMNDNIINSFLLVMSEMANERGYQVLVFETYLTSNIIQSNKVSVGYKRWAVEAQMWTKKVWLLPVHDEELEHWVLFVISLEHKTIFFIDSLHGDLNQIWLQNVCSFMNNCCTVNDPPINIDWSKWKCSIARDIPSQITQTSRNNCGTHVCAWAYTICSDSQILFKERDMHNARKNIAAILSDFKIARPKNQKIVDLRKIFFDNHRFEETRSEAVLLNTCINIPDMATFDFIQSIKR